MADRITLTVHADGLTWKVRCYFEHWFWRVPLLGRLLSGIGGVTLSRRTVRFKRARATLPLWFIGHELAHCRQARRLGWRYLPRYLWLALQHKFDHARHPMEVEAESHARAWEHNGQDWDSPAKPLPRTWHALPGAPRYIARVAISPTLAARLSARDQIAARRVQEAERVIQRDRGPLGP